ncbi:MAG TPA: efflux RND transporter periplasmic adaptor subunit [Candidatus Alistipes excrementipullorum]|nr:efflux RND transporter periplasmic adaptor subunit [Candidatus Alistipes excrementipullorum]
MRIINSKHIKKMKASTYPLLLCLLFLSACNGDRQNVSGGDYRTLTVQTSDLTLTSNYAAALRGRQTVEIRPQVSGVITDICIDEGDAVKKGQVLFVIDQVPYRAALDVAVANVKSAEAKLRTAQLTADSKEELFKEHVVSDFDRQMAVNELLEAQAALAQAKAEETKARSDLSYTEVKSPVNGVASMIPYRVGALVSSSISEPLVTVTDDSEIYAYFSMAENQMLDLIQQYGSLSDARSKMPAVSLVMSNGATYGHEGRINAISGTIDESTGAVGFRAVFDNPAHLLRNGGNGTIGIPVSREDCIVIPQAATYEIQNKIFVYKVVDGKAQSAQIQVYKYNDGNNYIVESGLKVGDTIIAEGAGLVREGTVVKTSESVESAK